jgi:hypothetical protein
VDVKTGFPIEMRIVDPPEGRTQHWDLFEKLPGTPENLALLDLKVAHPGATVNTDPAAYDQFTNKLFADQQAQNEEYVKRVNDATSKQSLEAELMP